MSAHDTGILAARWHQPASPQTLFPRGIPSSASLSSLEASHDA
jgi:hypothetical protein